MIASVSIITRNSTYNNCHKINAANNKLTVDVSVLNERERLSFDIVFQFEETITHFRDHDYTWIDANQNCVGAEFSPKVVKLRGGQLIQANLNRGIWEIKKGNPKVLYWRINPEDSKPITEYRGDDNAKIIVSAKQNTLDNFEKNFSPALLIANQVVEFSRSAIPFSAVACFTDHCDYDTAKSLTLQRHFFKENGIKVTKGFFLNHYSKRADNASYENDAAELEKWKNDGHELAYHSLSQSIKEMSQSFTDFKNFQPPFPVPTWIDHGYQPYNFSLFKNNHISPKEYESCLKLKNIAVLWNYTDSGTAAKGVINQFNSKDFTLDSFNKGNRNLSFTRRLSTMIKNIMFHYYADEKIILSYKKVAGNFKKVVHQKKIKYLLPLLVNFGKLSFPIFKILITWNVSKDKPYRLAKYAPVIFRHTIDKTEFYIFQTLEMVDFINALHPENVEKLIDEKGLFIAHTYFSAPMAYHHGRMFKTSDEVEFKVKSNFANLAIEIKNNNIWNPTLIDLVAHFKRFENVISDIDIDGNIFVSNAENVPFRFIK